MIKLVTLDLYQTLCHSDPPHNERLAAVCAQMGLSCRPDDFIWPNVLAEELYTVENGRRALHARTQEEREVFYQAMFALLLREAGLPHDDHTVAQIRQSMAATRAHVWRLYEDVLPTISALRARGLRIGVISNTSTDATILCGDLGVCDQVDFIVSSCLVGCEKPDPRIFYAALEHVGVTAAEAVHIGDQPRSDAIGAVSVGMHALLLDRLRLLKREREYERIASLIEVPEWVDARRSVDSPAATLPSLTAT